MKTLSSVLMLLWAVFSLTLSAALATATTEPLSSLWTPADLISAVWTPSLADEFVQRDSTNLLIQAVRDGAVVDVDEQLNNEAVRLRDLLGLLERQLAVKNEADAQLTSVAATVDDVSAGQTLVDGLLTQSSYLTLIEEQLASVQDTSRVLRNSKMSLDASSASRIGTIKEVGYCIFALTFVAWPAVFANPADLALLLSPRFADRAGAAPPAGRGRLGSGEAAH
jgi:hypothetical protein